MSDDWNNDDDQSQGSSGGGLRKQLEEALSELKESKKEAATAKRQLAESAALKFLKGTGYPPSVVKWASKDGVDLSDEKALNGWLAENGDSFAKSTPEQIDDEEDSSSLDDSQRQNPEIPEALRTHSDVMGQLRAAATPAELNKFLSVGKGLSADASAEEVDAAYRAAGL